MDTNNWYVKSPRIILSSLVFNSSFEKVQVGNDQEKAQSERESLSKNRGGIKV